LLPLDKRESFANSSLYSLAAFVAGTNPSENVSAGVAERDHNSASGIQFSSTSGVFVVARRGNDRTGAIEPVSQLWVVPANVARAVIKALCSALSTVPKVISSRATLAGHHPTLKIREKPWAFLSFMKLATRRTRAGPIVKRFGDWLENEHRTALPKSPFGQAVSYARNQWSTLGRYLDDARFTIDNNSAERAVLPLAIGRKNWLFVAGDGVLQTAAVLMSLCASAKRHAINPCAYLTDLLDQLAAKPTDTTPLMPYA